MIIASFKVNADEQPCHVATMSRKPAKGEYIETVSSTLSPLSLHPQISQSKHYHPLLQIAEHKSSPPHPSIGHRKQGLAPLPDHRDHEHHPRRQDRDPGRSHHPRRPPPHIPRLQPEREAGKPRRGSYRQVLFLQSGMRAEASREAI
jgi:hypothetical protein